MLTSYHTLLGGFTAVLCATGMVSQNSPEGSLSFLTDSSENLPVEIAYRGSGRLDEHPESGSYAQGTSPPIADTLMSHRGSGRIQPQCFL